MQIKTGRRIERAGRATLVLVVLALLVAAAALILWRSTIDVRAGEVPAVALTPTQAVPDPDPLTASAGRQTSSGSRPEVDAASEADAPVVSETTPIPPEEAPAPAAPDTETVRISGAAIRVDADGAEHASDDGTLGLVVHAGGRHDVRELPVLAGRFVLSAPPRAMLTVRELVLAGRSIRIDPPERSVPEDHFLVLRGSSLASVLLHVVSAVDGRELDGVDVFRGQGPHVHSGRHHPGTVPDGAPRARNAKSPIRIEPEGLTLWTTHSYWVRARGHAWDAVSLDHEAGGQSTVRLQPSATLDVELLFLEEWLRPLVRLWPADAGPDRAYAFAERAPDADGRATFEGLAPGTYTVSAERGWANNRKSFGAAEIEVAAGEREKVLVSLELPERPREVQVSGTLIIGGDWDRAGLALTFEAQDAASVWADGKLTIGLAEMRAATPERFAWSIALPIAGNYELAVAPLIVRRLLEVPPPGLENVEVIVPAPADVEVRLVDATSGEAIEFERLHWSPIPVEGILSTPVLPATFDPACGCFAFRAPAGRIGIWPVDMSLDFGGDDETYPVEAGENEIEIAATRRIGVKFHLRHRDTTLPWSWDWRLRAQKVGGAARDRARSIGMLWFEEPGKYELYADNGIPDYESIDGTTFEVRPLAAGEEALEVEVRLEPMKK